MTTAANGPDPVRESVVLDAIASRFRTLLSRDGSPLLGDEGVVMQLLAQMTGIARDTLQALGISARKGDTSRSAIELSMRIGQGRAVSGIHPSQSMHAAALLFEAALPVIAELTDDGSSADSAIRAATALTHAISRRMTIAAQSYIGVLLDKIHDANRDERRRISRELHDVVAPAILLALQSLELYDAYRMNAPEQAEQKLDGAVQTLKDAMATLRALAAETRESLSRNGLEHAIRHVLDRSSAELRTTLHIVGPLDTLSPLYREEIFLMVQEAIRNAAAHSKSPTLSLTMTVDTFEAVAKISDDGHGFDPSATMRDKHFGLASMRERAALLGGTVLIHSQLRHGTTVEIRIPLPPSTPAVR